MVPRIAAVSLLDTTPFLYGIRHEGNFRADLQLSSSQACVRNFNGGKADIALLPAAAVPALAGAHPVTGYCIGAAGESRAALLVGKDPVTEVRRVFYDPERQTEVRLAAYLLQNRWKTVPEYIVAEGDPTPETLLAGDFRLLAGEQALLFGDRFPVACDLTAEWRRAARLPFVLWLWMAREGVDEEWIEGLHRALTFGLEHTYEALLESDYASNPCAAYEYLTSFDFIFDNQKQKALHKFWDSGIKVAPRANPG